MIFEILRFLICLSIVQLDLVMSNSKSSKFIYPKNPNAPSKLTVPKNVLIVG